MKKWIFIAILIAVVILIVRSCFNQNKGLDKCLNERKGCELVGTDATFQFNEKELYNGEKFLKQDLPKEYPYLLRTEAEIKKNARIYIDVSQGLQAGVQEFSEFLKAMNDYMDDATLEIYYSSYEDNNGKIHDDPVLQTKGNRKILKEVQTPDPYVADWSYLQGTLDEIVKNPTKMSVFISDFVLSEGPRSGSVDENNNNVRYDCDICNNNDSWLSDAFVEWFGQGGQIIVATKEAILNNTNGQAYALIFIPKGHKVDQLIESLKEIKLTEEDQNLAIFNPLGLSIDISELKKLQSEDDQTLTVVTEGPGYVVIGADNTVLSDAMLDKKLSLKLVNQTGMDGTWELKSSEAIDFYDAFKRVIPESKLLHKNEKVQSQLPIEITTAGTTANVSMKTISNTGNTDLVLRKFNIFAKAGLSLNSEQFVGNVNVGKRRNPIIKENSCLLEALEKSLIKGSSSVNDKYYSQFPILTVYTIVNVIKEK